MTPRTAAATAFVSCQAVDVWQTHWALDNGYHETNDVMGEHPSVENMVAGKVAVLAAGAVIYHLLPDRYRTQALLLMTTPCAYAVTQNYNEGVRP